MRKGKEKAQMKQAFSQDEPSLRKDADSMRELAGIPNKKKDQ
jgi:hypothetical protein